MPLEKIVIEADRGVALWHISEDETSLAEQVGAFEKVPVNITNASKRLEWLAGRVLVKELMAHMGLPFKGITKDQYGKPSPIGYDYYLSLSHSHPFAAALVDKMESAGIDLEQPKEKLFRIAPRVLHFGELQDAGYDMIKHCIYWCAKEALVKIHGKKDLVFAEHLLIDPFTRSDQGDLRGRIISGDEERVIPLCYTVYPRFVVVFSKRSVL